MDTKQLKIVGLLILAVIGIWLLFSAFLAKKEPATTFLQFASKFDAAQALETTRQFNAEYPNRALGSIESRQSSGFLIERFERLGYKVSYSHFDAKVAGRTQVGRNIFAFKQGATDEILAVVSNYDTAGNTAQITTDSGVQIGGLIELARIFSADALRRSLLMIASDGQEWGMLGASDIAQNHPQRQRIVAVLSLEGVRTGELSGFLLDTAGQIGGSTPAWLRQLAVDVAARQGLPVAVPSGMREFLDKALVLSSADQGPFLNAGIPAINLNGSSSGSPRENADYGSLQNSDEKPRASDTEKYGKAAEQILRALDGLPEIPRESMQSFCVRNARYLSPGTISILLWLSFAPIIAALYFHLRNNHRYLTFKRIIRELSAFVGTILPFVATYYAIVLFRLMHLIPAYSFYPPNSGDALLSNPQWRLLAGLLAIVMSVGGGCYASFRFSAGKLARPDFYVSKTILLAIFVCAIAAALRYNSYWAVLFLLLPAWIWSLVGMGEGYGGSSANRIWIIAAGIPYYTVLVFYSSSLKLGGKALWYNVLSLSTGMFTLEGFLLAAATIAIGIRLLAIQSIRIGAEHTAN
jgi:hypothetical protein